MTGTAPPPTALAAPLTLPGGQILPNRLAKSALSEQLGDRRNGPTDDLSRLHRRPLAVLPDGPARLLDGSLAKVDAGERRIGVPKLDSAVDLYWHTRQLRHMGAGRDPRPGESAWRAAAGLLVENGWGAMRRRRGG